MKKFLLASLAAAALSLASLSASAATITGDFNVSVTLAARCVSTSTVQTLGFGTYDALGAGAGTPAPTVAITFDCTRGLTPPVVSFDAEATSNTTYGVIAGLNYSVTASGGQTAAGTAATAASDQVGSAAKYVYTLTGAMAAGQAGQCGGATATACNVLTTSATRTLKLTY